jgi:hypothetical protein
MVFGRSCSKMLPATTRSNWRWELKGSWTFALQNDGAILFYPHGWGRAYLVPTEDKRREIEEFLALWQTRSRSAVRFSRWCVVPVPAVILATATPPVWRIVSQMPVWPTISIFVLALGVLGCLVIAGSPLALSFLAETAKADLEKADVRRPLSEALKDYARRSDWSRLSLDAALGSLFLGFGVHQLMPRRVTVMHVASAGPHFWTLGVPGVVLGGWMVLSALLQIRTKVSADEHR